nr:hypothetical protein [Tanacetum cinerariifolium]
MPKSIHFDHHDTAHYIPMYHRTGGFTGHEREVYMSLVSRLIDEGRVIDSTFLDDQPNLRSTFAAIGFNCLLNIDENICPIFVLQFYKSVRIIRVCVYTPEWPISSLQNGVDSHPDIYPPPHEDSSLICNALFYERTQPKTQKMKGVDTFLDPFQMIVSEFKDKGKRPRLLNPTPSNYESSDSPSPTPHQRVENDLVNNYTLDPILYMNQLSPIKGGESLEFKQTKGMFKCLFHFLSKKK